MHEANAWKYSAGLFTAAIAALLLAGAYREIESASLHAAAPVSGASQQAPATNAEPENGKPPSNEIQDFPQLD